ncbi:putative germin, rmlC-like cupin domain-containing protein [Lupinus albus]|uniref:Germin-like protein n=1 Tax=Lupinus albus TaxID=3870 RepID=A0A6A4QLR5_LUPAL|nr:putative germin, rmlC-like cupin domain-containing protein [Lupinus albus]
MVSGDNINMHILLHKIHNSITSSVYYTFTMSLVFFLFGFLLSSITSHVSARDFCACKLPKDVTVEDFLFSNFKVGPPNQFNFSTISATVDNFPALNGLGFSLARAELEEGATVPLHTHPDATEVVIAGSGPGKYTTGFITSDNVVYIKTLSEGDIFVIPKGLLHFGINSGKGKSVGLGVFSSENPSIEVLDLALFGNNLDSAILQKTTFLDIEQIKKLKTFFKGSG